MSEAPFEVEHSRAFVLGALPEGCRRVVEVGCGDGALAARLATDGLSVLALDADAEAVDAARRRGVDAQVGVWPMRLADKADALLFTRSLHHIHALAQSVDAAAACLAPRGRVIVEEFAQESVDARTLRWFAGVARLLAASGQLAKADGLVDALLTGDDFLGAWRADHDHDLHTAGAMKEALQGRFSTVTTRQGPYLFRYLTSGLVGAARRDDVLRAVARQEEELIAEGTIAAVGWRFVGTIF